MEEPRRLGDRYELGAVLGRGGMAEVYLGRDIRLGRTVAVKTLRADLARDPSFQARFRREAQSAASLNHPAIVAVYDTGEDYINGISIPYIVMEYVDGSTLRELLHSGRRLLPERALEMTAGVLQALEYSHRNGIIHRDIKPANVMLTRQGTVKVMDFGIARAMADNGMTMTQTAAVIGTAQYLSPEQARGETVDARSDLYSAGCLLYELLTERPPFVGDSPVAVAYQHVREDPLPPSAYDPEVSPTIDAIVLKSLAKHPDHRYQSADEMRADLERALHGMPIAAPAVMAPMEAATQYLPPTPGGATSQTGAYGSQGRPPQQYDQGPDDYDDDEPPRQRGWAWALLAIACVAVLVAAFFVGKTLLGDSGGAKDDKTVPTLIGKTEQEATSSLDNAGLKIKVAADKKACDQKKDTVCEQDKQPDSKLPKDSVVTVIMSSGPATAKVPQVVGQSEDAAVKAITDAGFTPKVNRVVTSQCQRGNVCATDPVANSDLALKSDVTLTVSSGKAQVDIPTLTGLTQDDATNKLKDLKLNPRIRMQYSADRPQGTVISYSPDKGPVDEGTTITLIISQGPSPAPTTTPPTTPPGGQTTPPGGPSTQPGNPGGNTKPITNPFDPKNWGQ